MPILDFLGQVASAFGAAPDSAHKRIWEEVAPWIKTLMVQAAPKWLPRLTIGVPCEVAPPQRQCPRSAIAACDVCQKPCCLEHSRIDKHGDAICYACIATSIQRAKAEHMVNGTQPRQHQWWPPPGAQPPSPPPGPTKEELAAAWKTLKLKQGSKWEEVEASYKDLLRKHHPDRQRTPDAKAKAEAKFKAVRAAYDLLKRVRDQ